MFTTLDKKKQIGWTISILIPLIIAFIPVSENFTVSLKLFFMITLFMILIIAFELFPLLVSAILLPSLYMVSGIVPASAAFGSWSNTTVWMVLGGLIFSTVLDECVGDQIIKLKDESDAPAPEHAHFFISEAGDIGSV